VTTEDFGGPDEVSISRSDLRRLAEEPQLDRFVMAVIVWGYPSGDQYGNITNFAYNPTGLGVLTNFLTARRGQPITNRDVHFKTVPVKGIKLSTYTKFLNFLSVKIRGQWALILDNQIVRVTERGIFAELLPLREMNEKTKDRMYPTYVKRIHEIADEMRVPAENIEFFLYEFGSSLKDIEQNIRLRAYQFNEQRNRVDGFALDDWLGAEGEIRGTPKPAE